jgi:hypothetical protein
MRCDKGVVVEVKFHHIRVRKGRERCNEEDAPGTARNIVIMFTKEQTDVLPAPGKMHFFPRSSNLAANEKIIQFLETFFVYS